MPSMAPCGACQSRRDDILSADPFIQRSQRMTVTVCKVVCAAGQSMVIQRMDRLKLFVMTFNLIELKLTENWHCTDSVGPDTTANALYLMNTLQHTVHPIVRYVLCGRNHATDANSSTI